MNKLIKEWKPNKEKFIDHYTGIICASRRSGKSIFVKFLVCVKNGLLDNSDIVLVFTSGVNRNTYAKFIPNEHIITGYKPDVINRIMDIQDINKQKNKDICNISIILDDVIEYRTRYDKALERVFFQGRHYNISLLYVTQSLSTVPPAFLRNTDYFIYFKFFLKSDRKKISELLGMYGEEELVKKIIQLHEKYKLFIFDMVDDSDHVLDRLRWFKVPKKFVDA